MPLQKSKRKAIILSSITVLTFSVTDAVLNLLLPYLQTGDIRSVVADPTIFTKPSSLMGLLLFIAFILGILIAVGAFWLYRFFGEKYYDRQSGIRFALFGFLFALFLKIPDWVLAGESWILRGFLQFIGLFAAFFIVRWLIPFSEKLKTR